MPGQEHNVAQDPMQGWKIAGVIALAVIVLSIPYYVAREMRRASPSSRWWTRPGSVLT